MNCYTVSFFGHRKIEKYFTVEYELEKIIQGLLCRKEYVEFLVGRDGDFDQVVSSTIHRCKRTIRDDNSSLVWVMPYTTANYRDNEDLFQKYYDEIEVCNSTSCCHYKAAFKLRNQYMVDRSDLIVFYIDHKYGGHIRQCNMQGSREKNI